MTVRDALFVIAHRDRLPDLEQALALVGVALSDGSTAVEVGRALAEEPVELLDDEPEPAAGEVAATGWSADEVRRTEQADTELAAGTRRGAGRMRDADGQGTEPPRPKQARSLGVIAGILDSESAADDAHGLPSARAYYRPVPIQRGARPTGMSADASVFAVRTLTSTLHSMVRVRRESAEPDIDAAVARIAEAEAIERVPLLQRRGQPDRVCILYELRLRSGPYREDLRFLLDAIRRVFGDERLDIKAFAGSPAQGCGDGPVWTWAPYVPPPSPAATLLIGDGAVTGSSEPDELDAYAMALFSAGHEVSTVLIGADPAVPGPRPYSQLLVRD